MIHHGGDHHNNGVGETAFDDFGRFESVQTGHHYVHQDNVRSPLGAQLDRFDPIASFFDLESVHFATYSIDHHTVVFDVIDDQKF